MNFDIPDNPEYNETLRKLQKNDPANADLFNELFGRLILNDAFFNRIIPAMGICTTKQNEAGKEVSCPRFVLRDGARIMVTFTQGSSTNYMTLNVNGTGGAAVWFPVGETSIYNNEAIAKFIAAGCAYEFIYQDGDTPKWVYCGIVSTAETLGAVKKSGDTMTGDLSVPGINGLRLLRCSGDAQASIGAVMDYIADWQHTLLFTAGWDNPFVPDKNRIFGFGGMDVLTAISHTGKIYTTYKDNNGTPHWAQVGLSKAEVEADFLSLTGGRVTGNLEVYAEPAAYTESQVNVMRGDRGGRLVVSANNYFGLYDITHAKWVVRADPDGNINLYGHAETASDASRSDALQSLRENMTSYDRGEYVICSVFDSQSGRFCLRCINNNSDANTYQTAVDRAGSAGSADKSEYLRTFSAIGQTHGDSHLLKCQHNIYGDGYFGFVVDGDHKVEVDHALAATRDGVGNIITDTYMPKSGGTFTRQVDFDVYGKKISVGSGIIASEDYVLNFGNYQGRLVRLVLQTDESSGNEAHLSVYPDYRDADTRYSDCYLGTSSEKWDGLYAKNGTILTSDKNHKTDIRNLDTETTVKFIKGLVPSSYKMVDGQSGRTHYGLIAQDIEVLMGELGMSSLDFAGFIKSPKIKEIWEDENGEKLDKPVKEVIEGEFDYALRYDEFIAPIVSFIQCLDDGISNLTKEVEALREENTDLKKRLEALEKIILKTGGADGT